MNVLEIVGYAVLIVGVCVSAVAIVVSLKLVFKHLTRNHAK